ncbi:MAG: patatin-like phospholipase family protein [Bacteroidales bacterium]|nr:patatin-like phospholipase family protein [Bacteroidales bacterium]
MKITDFTLHPDVFHLIEDLKNENIPAKHFSDVLDGDGNQYVELVMEGGGVLGVALIGYNYVLEQMGLRFFSLAGTSAGSINALLLAGMGDVSKPKAEKLVDVLANKNLMEFVDGDSDAQDFVEAIVKGAGIMKMIWKGAQVVDNIRDDIGLNPGNNFLEWMSGILENNGVESVADLEKKFGTVPAGLKIRDGIKSTIDGLEPRFTVIATDLTTETKVEFPRMASLYWQDSKGVNPAIFVRASMSVPFFFNPLIIENIPQGEQALQNWKTLVSFNGLPPKSCCFVDGGLMSNFPMDVFHKINVVPRMPTFGVRLGIDRDKANNITGPGNLFGAMFNSIRHLHDYDFILRNPDYKQLLEKIDIGNHNWLNFAMPDDDKIDLFVRGARAAAQFLRKFNWQNYKALRQKQVDAFS